MEEVYLEKVRSGLNVYPRHILLDLLKSKEQDLLKRINKSPHIHLAYIPTNDLDELFERNHRLEKMAWKSVKIPPEIMYSLRLSLNYKPVAMKTLKNVFDFIVNK